ncbi:unnamed protein product [Parnassius apollo]|uniref:(apollo) hypothetical protein n=1 Tax=Parnassius apollo TaxID=110799 RepID=A0A8S3WYD1_PARAO|nr:unnamed protein product [Parnassius apollo]
MKVYYFLFLCVCCVISNGDKESEDDNKRRRLIEQLTKTRTVILDNYHLVTRQIATDVYMYRSYRTVSVIFYPIMRDVTDARFTFQSEELHLNNIGSCSPKDVIINIKHGSYPAVNPDGYDFPKYFVDPASREHIHTIELLSDGKNRTYSIRNPKPGNWYALVYIKWEDPRSQTVEQQGLVADCHTILYTDLQVKRKENIGLIDCYRGVTVDYKKLPAAFKCMSIDSTEPVSLNLTIKNTSNNNTEILFRVQSLSLPTDDNYIISCSFDPRLSNAQIITFNPFPNAWHYVQLDYVVGNATRYADCESYYLRSDLEEVDNQTTLDLMRDDKGRFFTFDYGLPTTDLQDATSLVNLTSGEVKSLRYKVNQFLDIGGNLAIEASLLMSLKYYMGYRRESKKGALLAFTEDNQFFKVVICLDIGHASVPLETGHCKFNDHVKPALFVLNSTDSETIYDRVIIPYPDSGTWYITLRLFCDEVVCPCPTSDNGTKYYVDPNALDRDEEDDIVSSNNTRQGNSACNATALLSLSSTSCLGGRCSNHGSCGLNTFGGLVMSFCSCSAGYGSWDCSDESRMDSRVYMLVSVLLLTLSNLLFFFSIYVAVIRLYYTEAMMYTFTMVFSTFYHACDAPAQVAYCITRDDVASSTGGGRIMDSPKTAVWGTPQ